MTISRIRVVLSGAAVVGPSVTTFYADSAPSTAITAIRAFFDAIKSSLPTGLTVSVPNSGDDLDEVSGTLTGSWTAGSTPAPVTGTNAGQWASGVGCRISWGTGGIHHGRRVKGTTFLVPLPVAAYASGGGLDDATRSQIQTAAGVMLAAAPDLTIWSRPGAVADGQASAITSVTVPDAVSWLRSRRT